MMAKKRIMIVEDEGITAMRIQNGLHKIGYTVTSTQFSGEEALKKMEKDRPDLVLMDIVLDGEMDGIEAAKQIHSRYNIPVIFLTAHSDEKMIRRIQMSEPFGYIVKPFEDKDLHIAVEIAFYKYEMEEKLRKSEKDLRKHKENLEELVNERTADLISSNELLREEINDRMLAKQEAARAGHLAALGELAAGVAHEINNPVNGIMNYAQLLINKSGISSEEQDIAGRIIKESDRIANIIKSLLSFARESDDEKRPVHIHGILSTAIALTGTQLRNDGIDVKVDIQKDLPQIIAQPQQIVQVFLNLLSNARHAFELSHRGTHDDKIIQITAMEITGHYSPHIGITFHDNGSGIPAGIMDKIMNPFFTTKNEEKGTGLGLSISHGIIKDHGGNISINSVEGAFTEVEIELPVE